MKLTCAIRNILCLSLVFRTTLGLPIQTPVTHKYKVTVESDAMGSLTTRDDYSVKNLFTTESTPRQLISTLETSTIENDRPLLSSTTGLMEEYRTKDAFTAASDDVLSMSKIITQSQAVSIMPRMRTHSELSIEDKNETLSIAIDDVIEGSGHSQGNKVEDEQTSKKIDNTVCDTKSITIVRSNAAEIPQRLTKSETEDIQNLFIVFEKSITTDLTEALKKATNFLRRNELYGSHPALLSLALDPACAPQFDVNSYDNKSTDSLIGAADAILSYLYYAYQSIAKFSPLTPQNNWFLRSVVSGDYIRRLTSKMKYLLCVFNDNTPDKVVVHEQATGTKCDDLGFKSLAMTLVALENNLIQMKNILSLRQALTTLPRSTSTVVPRTGMVYKAQAIGK